MDTKVCSKCGEEKKLSEFYNDKNRKDGLYCYCKRCSCKGVKIWRVNNLEKSKELKKIWNNSNNGKKYKIEYRKINKDKIKKGNKMYYEKNRENLLKKQKEYRYKNKEKIKERGKIYYEKNKEKSREYHKKYYEENSDKIKKQNRNWRKNNRDKINKNTRQYRKKKLSNNIYFRLRNVIRSSIIIKLKKRLLSKDSKSTFSFLPYTIDDLIKHLESKFEPWMNWQNYGFGRGRWTIDHIRPDSSFNYTSVEDEEFQKCWALENLQPMEFIENCRKNKYYE